MKDKSLIKESVKSIRVAIELKRVADCRERYDKPLAELIMNESYLKLVEAAETMKEYNKEKS